MRCLDAKCKESLSDSAQDDTMTFPVLSLDAPFASLDTADKETRNVTMYHTREDRMASAFPMIDPWVNPNFAATQAATDGESGARLVYYAFDLLHLR